MYSCLTDKVVNLPTVPEDVYSNLIGKPTRSSSASSLKGVRKVKLYLQRACNASDDEDESSELDEHEFSKISIVSTFTYTTLVLREPNV